MPGIVAKMICGDAFTSGSCNSRSREDPHGVRVGVGWIPADVDSEFQQFALNLPRAPWWICAARNANEEANLSGYPADPANR